MNRITNESSGALALKTSGVFCTYFLRYCKIADFTTAFLKRVENIIKFEITMSYQLRV